jgi:hypothetical protein
MWKFIVGLCDCYDQYFSQHEHAIFGPLMSNFINSIVPLSYLTHVNNDLRIHKLVHFLDSRAISKIDSIVKKSDAIFKQFVLSSGKLIQYDKCRALKEVPRLDMLIDKFKEDESYRDIKASVYSLVTNIDEKGHLYYAIAHNLTGSNLEVLPKELIGHIFHYVDGDVDMSLG